MKRQILLRSPPANRNQPLLTDTQIPRKMISFGETPKTRRQQSKDKNSSLGEVAGGTAADCAAVCCCCPCTLMNLLVLTVYKLPAGICRKVTRKGRKKKKKKHQGLLVPNEGKGSHGDDEQERELRSVMERCKSVHDGVVDATETVELEKEMWGRFYSTGFWRSPSQTQHSF